MLACEAVKEAEKSDFLASDGESLACNAIYLKCIKNMK